MSNEAGGRFYANSYRRLKTFLTFTASILFQKSLICMASVDDFSTQQLMLVPQFLNNFWIMIHIFDLLPFSHSLMINVKINSRFITIDNLSARPKKVRCGARESEKEKFMWCLLAWRLRSILQLILEHLNYSPLMFLLAVAAQRWINTDYGLIKRKFIKDIPSVFSRRTHTWKMT